MVGKKEIRSACLAYRKMLSTKEFEKKNSQLLSITEQLIQVKKPKIVHSFLPISKNREPDLNSLFPKIWGKGLQIISSHTDFKNKKLLHFLLNPNTKICYNSMGIPEPDITSSTPFKEVSKIDMIFVPMLIGDKKLNRIGYGGGYYDQLLKNMNHAYKVGLLFFPPVDSLIQVDPWDIPLDCILYPDYCFNRSMEGDSP